VPSPAGTLDVSRLGVTELARLRLSGLTFSEEEVTAALAKRLAARPVQADGLPVDRVFLELHPRNSMAFLYTRVYGLHITFTATVIHCGSVSNYATFTAQNFYTLTPGTLFFCVSGFTRDGHDFAPEAIARGAVALVVQRPLALGVPEDLV